MENSMPNEKTTSFWRCTISFMVRTLYSPRPLDCRSFHTCGTVFKGTLVRTAFFSTCLKASSLSDFTCRGGISCSHDWVELFQVFQTLTFASCCTFSLGFISLFSHSLILSLSHDLIPSIILSSSHSPILAVSHSRSLAIPQSRSPAFSRSRILAFTYSRVHVFSRSRIHEFTQSGNPEFPHSRTLELSYSLSRSGTGKFAPNDVFTYIYETLVLRDEDLLVVCQEAV